MTPEEILPYYQARIQHTQGELKALQTRINRIALLRLLIFIAGVFTVIKAYDHGWELSVAAGIICLIPFLYLVKVHERVFNRKTFTLNLLKVLEEEAAIQQAGHRKGGDDLFTDDEHPYTADLDIFGPESLFHELERCATLRGKQRLADWLAQKSIPEEIAIRQQAVRELQALPEWRESYLAEGKSNQDNSGNLESLMQWLQEPDWFRPKKGLRLLLYAIPVFVLAMVALYLLGRLPWTLLPSALTPGLFVMWACIKYINQQYEKAGEKYKLLRKYAGLVDWLARQSFSSSRMTEIKQVVSGKGQDAAAALRTLGRLLDVLDSRPNLIATLLTNGLYVRDVRVAYALEDWKNKYRTHVPQWLDALAETDALISLGFFAYNYPDLVMPEVSADGPLLEAEGLAHPFIAAGKRVGNDVKLDTWGQIILITGSNMAGKSTFLRAAGVNMVLALAGAPVCATRMRLQPVSLFTSMRIGDSIRDSESTFYAELKRLKTILQKLQQGEPLLVLLDEILRGTNSADKLTGSFALMRQLLALPAAGLVATHDLQLATLAEEYPGKLQNFNFEVQIIEDRFRFDYRLRPGVCRTLNATQLMRQMGINIE